MDPVSVEGYINLRDRRHPHGNFQVVAGFPEVRKEESRLIITGPLLHDVAGQPSQ